MGGPYMLRPHFLLRFIYTKMKDSSMLSIQRTLYNLHKHFQFPFIPLQISITFRIERSGRSLIFSSTSTSAKMWAGSYVSCNSTYNSHTHTQLVTYRSCCFFSIPKWAFIIRAQTPNSIWVVFTMSLKLHTV